MSQLAPRGGRTGLYLVGPARTEEAHTNVATIVALQDSLDDFSSWLTAQTASARTARERVTIVNAFGHFVGVDPRLAQVVHVVTYLSRSDLSSWSRLAYWHHLKAWFNWLQSTGGRADHPMAGMRSPKAPRGAPRPLTRSQVNDLLIAASPRMTTWLLLGLHAGLRAHEIAKLRGADFDGTEIFVAGKGGVTDLLPAHPILLVEAKKYGRGYWFPSRGPLGHVRPETVSHTSAVFFRSLGIDGAIHRCRHTYATELLRAGVNVRVVQSLMRHSSLDTTARYTAVDEAERRHAIGLLPLHGAA